LSGAVEYAITGGNDAGVFAIVPNGTIVTRSALDRETRAQYALTVTATDSAPAPQRRLSTTAPVSNPRPSADRISSTLVAGKFEEWSDIERRICVFDLIDFMVLTSSSGISALSVLNKHNLVLMYLLSGLKPSKYQHTLMIGVKS